MDIDDVSKQQYQLVLTHVINIPRISPKKLCDCWTNFKFYPVSYEKNWENKSKQSKFGAIA